MLDINQTKELLSDNPEYIEILQRAVDKEETLKTEAFLFNWEDIMGETELYPESPAAKKLKDFLNKQFYPDWMKTAIVLKPTPHVICVRDTTTSYQIYIKPDNFDPDGIDVTSFIAIINDNTDRSYRFDVINNNGVHELYRSGTVIWQWHHVQAAPASINKLIREGIVKIVYKTNKYTEYALVDRDEIKFVLDQVKFDQDAAEYDIEQNGTDNGNEQIQVPDDAFDIIVGYDDVKSIIMKSLESEKPVNVLFIGTPGTAKSMFLEELNRIPGSSYHLGSSSTKAGLNEFLFDVQPRILLIDELEKMDPRDYAVLLSLMEGGKVVETKKNRRREITLNTIVFAACNTTKKIPPENMSR
ncbi:MAG: AAA family ATPase, partial [bacterium]